MVTGSHNGDSREDVKKQKSRGQVPPPPRRPRPFTQLLPRAKKVMAAQQSPASPCPRGALSPGDADGTKNVSQERPALRAPLSPPDAARPGWGPTHTQARPPRLHPRAKPLFLSEPQFFSLCNGSFGLDQLISAPLLYPPSLILGELRERAEPEGWG